MRRGFRGARALGGASIARDPPPLLGARDTAPVMSEHLDLVGSILSAWERRDFRSVSWALVRLRGRGKTSGLDLQAIAANGAEVWHIHGGKVTRLVMCWNRERALADLGLEA